MSLYLNLALSRTLLSNILLPFRLIFSWPSVQNYGVLLFNISELVPCIFSTWRRGGSGGRRGGSVVVRQTVVLQSLVRIRRLPSPAHSWLPISWWVATWDGTWQRADLCERQQRTKLWKMDRWFAKKHIKKKNSVALPTDILLTLCPKLWCPFIQYRSLCPVSSAHVLLSNISRSSLS